MNDLMAARRRSNPRRVTADLPVAPMKPALEAVSMGMAGTANRGLEKARRSPAAAKARSLRGRIQFDVDLEVSREHTRR